MAQGRGGSGGTGWGWMEPTRPWSRVHERQMEGALGHVRGPSETKGGALWPTLRRKWKEKCLRLWVPGVRAVKGKHPRMGAP